MPLPARLRRTPQHRHPSPAAVATAAALALAASLVADFLLARLAVALFPGLSGYPHFRFGDYATLTVPGVLAACAAWPVVIRLCEQPRWVFARLAVAVTAVLLLPDLAILVQGQPARAVLFLVLMHLAIAIVTYTLLVRLAPPRRRAEAPALDR